MDDVGGCVDGRDGAAVTLTADQQRAVDLCLAGRSTAVLGPAGTGKSLVLRTVVRALRARGLPDSAMPVTAPTGIAALNVGGVTIHSWGGIGLARPSAAQLAKKIEETEYSRTRWEKAKVLIIDEISMMSGELLDKLEYIARTVRCNEAVFGGLAVIVFGDFAQLPPVRATMYAFESRTWARLYDNSRNVVSLTTIMRQRGDGADEFIRLLHAIRTGNVSDEIVSALNKLQRPLPCKDGIQPTMLYSHNAEVDEINEKRIRDLPGTAVEYAAKDEYGGEQEALTQLNRIARAPEVLTLKLGAQVVLIYNIDPAAGLVNGSRGVVTVLGEKPTVRFSNGVSRIMEHSRWATRCRQTGTLAIRMQFPLRLAYAMTIHKSQGMSIDSLAVSVNESFEPGQAYVALSRATSMAGLQLIGAFDRSAIVPSDRISSFFAALEGGSPFISSFKNQWDELDRDILFKAAAAPKPKREQVTKPKKRGRWGGYGRKR